MKTRFVILARVCFFLLPEYFFIAEYNGVKSEKSKLLYCKGWVNELITDEENNPLSNTDCFVILNDKVISAKTDKDGYIKYNFQNIGAYKIVVGAVQNVR